KGCVGKEQAGSVPYLVDAVGTALHPKSTRIRTEDGRGLCSCGSDGEPGARPYPAGLVAAAPHGRWNVRTPEWRNGARLSRAKRARDGDCNRHAAHEVLISCRCRPGWSSA